ncbi:hypothetical protein RB195_025182 [Necator americanus]|uniref:Uncharacterized protein n=1 Tax=Necator americanus TaxID=51031 RepID=A0ABR1ER65_NECAM
MFQVFDHNISSETEILEAVAREKKSKTTAPADNHSIMIKDMDYDLANLSIFVNGTEATASCLENDLTLTLDCQNRQVDTAATIWAEWTHLKGDPSLTLGTPGDQVVIQNRIP